MIRKAVILGGSHGLGQELVKEAISRGITPLVLGRNSADIPGCVFDVSYKVDLSDSLSVGGASARVGLWWDESAEFFFWNAAVLEVKPIDKIDDPKGIIEINYGAPTRIIRSMVRFAKYVLRKPVHLVVISSTSSWKARKYQADYCGTKAAQAQFSRALALELRDDLPGSKVTLVKPAGMKTSLFRRAAIDTSAFMDPADVSKIIWDEVLRQRKFFKEFEIHRSDGKPVIVRRTFVPILFEENV